MLAQRRRKQKKQAVEEANESVTVFEEPEDSRERYEQEDRERVDKETDHFVKKLPDRVELGRGYPRKNRNDGPPSLEHWDKLGFARVRMVYAYSYQRADAHCCSAPPD